MPMPSVRSAVLGSVLGTAALLWCGCGGSATLTSHWNTNQVQLDGQVDEWGSIYRLVASGDLDFAVRNDHEFLYVSVLTNNRDVQRQLLWQGLILWIDSQGGRDRKRGIRFPVGLSERFVQDEAAVPSSVDVVGDWQPEELADQALQELQILSPGERKQSWAVVDLDRLRVEASVREAWFAYEMKIPLAQAGATGFAVNAAPGDVISLGLHTPEPQRTPPPEIAGERTRPGSSIGMGDLGESPGRAALGRGRMIPPGQIDSWATVKLARPQSVER